jgi:hypothetical protein
MKRMSILCTTYGSSIFQDLHKSEQPKKTNMILTDPNWAMKMKMRILADSNYTNEEDQHPWKCRLRNEEEDEHPCRSKFHNEEDEHLGCSTEA